MIRCIWLLTAVSALDDEIILGLKEWEPEVPGKFVEEDSIVAKMSDTVGQAYKQILPVVETQPSLTRAISALKSEFSLYNSSTSLLDKWKALRIFAKNVMSISDKVCGTKPSRIDGLKKAWKKLWGSHKVEPENACTTMNDQSAILRKSVLEAAKDMMHDTAAPLVDSNDSMDQKMVDSNIPRGMDTEEQSLVNSIDQGTVDSKELSLINSRDQGTVDSKELSLVNSRDQGNVDSQEQSLVNSRDQGIVDSKELSLVNSRDQGNVDSQEQSLVNSRDQGIVDSEKLSLVDSQGQGTLNSKEEPMVHSFGQPSVHSVDQPSADSVDQPSVERTIDIESLNSAVFQKVPFSNEPINHMLEDQSRVDVPTTVDTDVQKPVRKPIGKRLVPIVMTMTQRCEEARAKVAQTFATIRQITAEVYPNSDDVQLVDDEKADPLHEEPISCLADDAEEGIEMNIKSMKDNIEILEVVRGDALELEDTLKLQRIIELIDSTTEELRTYISKTEAYLAF